MNDWYLCIGNLQTGHEFERIKLFDLDINQTTLCEEWVQGIYDVTISLEVVLIVHFWYKSFKFQPQIYSNSNALCQWKNERGN